jgi:superfamily II DNA or RNA helicase
LKLELREAQVRAIELLREGFAQGHRSQILAAPVGFGKTEVAIALLDAAKKKGTRSAMILDRIVLCDQTSQRLDKYGIDHGVLQSGHWRYRPGEYIQVCSAQTLEARGSVPDTKLLIIDECHCSRKATNDLIKNNPHIKVVGLSATPLTKGLGKIYSNVINPITTKELVEKKLLTPLKVFISKEIDMKGAKKVAGEWSDAEASSRAMKIVGDVVAEWVTKYTASLSKQSCSVLALSTGQS